MKALCFGSLNIDYVYKVPHFVAKGETLASEALERYCGGKGLNQAVALSRAGLNAYMAGSAGRDGGFLVETLKTAGVDTRFVLEGETPTGHAIIQNTPDGDNCILLFGGANRTITREQAEQILYQFDEGDLLLLQNEISALDEIIMLAKERKLRIALNPSPMEAALKRLPPENLDFLILNRVEATQLLAREEADAEMLLRGLVDRYPKSVIVLTLGEEGSMLWNGHEICRQPALRVTTVDTTGAGDAFTGYFLAGLMERGDMRFALRFAATAAGIAVTRPGASPSIPDRDEVLQRMNV